jgi:hypothetical protein
LHSRAERGAGVFVVFGKVAENREKVDYHATALRGMLKMPKKFGTGIEYTGYATPAAESPSPSTYCGLLSAPQKTRSGRSLHRYASGAGCFKDEQWARGGNRGCTF